MTESVERLYRITHDPADDWSGIFFGNDLEAERAIRIMTDGLTLCNRRLSLSLEQVAIVLPKSRSALVDLLNAGPQSIVRARQTLETINLNL
ncbi:MULTISPECIES: hypothetical protein [Ochrobactrum]|jgi:hypothetical protein|uniref:Uncharacterized protein n=1 Tax=Ochrobactrum quorumnocens TaxID=271865 RepID=A0A5N1JV78_9HYPH|nr:MULTISPECIES: hypothetical protein [Brucella/Ochrobactrum group]KAA9367138.1 hypothetical protein F3W84_15145 [[Ochrobactrum] quorumnocens]MBD7992766.1 hypothetical protein [Ochrobactrum gallinarum]MDH7793188.1 hypothetical protein [Ochrobactrum sp. AN78]